MDYIRIYSPGTPPILIEKKTGARVVGDFSGVLNSAMQQPATDLDGIFEQASRTYGVPVSLLKAVAKVESNFRPNATSRCGAMGVMQLMPRTAEWLGVKDAYDPEQNIMGGAKYLSKLLNQYDGNIELTLAAYNAGPGTVRKYGGVVPPFAQGYVNKVLRNLGGDLSAGGTLSAIVASYGPKITPSTATTNHVLSAATGDDGADILPTLLLLKTMSEMRLLKTIDGERETYNPIFGSEE